MNRAPVAWGRDLGCGLTAASQALLHPWAGPPASPPTPAQFRPPPPRDRPKLGQHLKTCLTAHLPQSWATATRMQAHSQTHTQTLFRRKSMAHLITTFLSILFSSQSVCLSRLRLIAGCRCQTSEGLLAAATPMSINASLSAFGSLSWQSWPRAVQPTCRRMFLICFHSTPPYCLPPQ